MSRWFWVWIPLAFFVMCAGWALTSPVGAAPDDDYHLTSIWCAQGVRTGVCEESPTDPMARLVPRNVVQASDCYRFDGSVSAGCTATVRNDATLVETTRVNETVHLYPKGYYLTMSAFVGPDVEHSVLMMRLFNAAIAALLLAALLRLVPPGLAAAAVGAIAVTFIPLGVATVSSTNPSAWTIIGIGTYWAFAVAFLRHRNWRDRRGLLLAACTVVAAVLAMSSRVDANSYVLIATVLALTVSGWRRALHTPGRLALLAALSIAAVITYLTVAPSAVGGEAFAETHAGAGLLLTNLAYLPVLFQGIVGGTQLGWNDTLMPPLIPVVGVIVLGALLYRGLQQPTRRILVTSGIAALALVAVPITFLQMQHLGVGEVVQPRYLLPLLTLLIGVVSLGPRLAVGLNLPRVPQVLIAGGLSVSAILAFWANAHRYFAGSGFGLFDPKVSPEWLSSTGLPLWLITICTGAASIAFVTGVFVVFLPSASRR